MSYTIKVRFRKPADYSNANKDRVIWTLPPIYRVSRDDLDDMNRCGWHSFEFKNQGPATNFANKLMAHAGGTFDIMPGFGWNATKAA